MTYLRPVLPFLVLLIFLAFSRCSSRRWRRAGIAAIAALALWTWPPVSFLLSKTLESRYPATAYPPGDADVIVVLSGSHNAANPSQPAPFVGLDTYLRCQRAAWLYNHWRRVPVVATGGPTRGGSVAAMMRTVLEAAGVPPAMVRIEEKSTSTYENAAYTAELLHRRGLHRIALVTDAYHMLRSEKSFRKQGLAVVPAPSNYRSIQFNLNLANLLPSGKALLANDDCLHEWIGLLWYKVSGRI